MKIAPWIAVAILFGWLSNSVSSDALSKQNWMRTFVDSRAGRRERVPDQSDRVQRPPSSRIAYGGPAVPDANPFQVALLNASISDVFAARYCGGTLYRPNIVVTAAHCSDFIRPDQVQVLTGARALDGTGVRRNVTKIVIHPNWNPDTFDSDIAVWTLSSNADGIKTAILADTASEQTRGMALITGWGQTQGGFPRYLQQAFIPLQPKSDCNDMDSYYGLVTRNMFCAGYDEGIQDWCTGDDGGPLTVKFGDREELANYIVLTGVMSWGIACSEAEFFGVFTRIARFKTWIELQSE